MFVRRFLTVWIAASVFLVVVVGGLAALAARQNAYDIQLPQRELLTTGPSRATSRFRNLSLQPEAAKLSRRLGQRFIGSESDVSVLIGEVTTAGTRIPLRIMRNNQDLRNMPIENFELNGANIGLVLSDLSMQKNLAIGLEVSSQDDLSQTKTVLLQIKRGTLADVLNSIVKQNPLYTWKIQDGVINVLPVEANRDPLLRDVLETRLEKFSIERGMSNLMYDRASAPFL